MMDMTVEQGLNWYDLFRENPPSSKLLSESERMVTTIIDGESVTYKSGMSASEYTPWLKHLKAEKEVIMAKDLDTYINSAEVRAALHVNSTQKIWYQCQPDASKFNYNLQYEGSVWIYPILKAYGYNILFYSGDTDGAVPTLGSRRWIQKMNWEVT